MVAVNAVVTVLGALYVTELVVWALSEPAPVSAHATPPFFESFDTVAVMLALCASVDRGIARCSRDADRTGRTRCAATNKEEGKRDEKAQACDAGGVFHDLGNLVVILTAKLYVLPLTRRCTLKSCSLSTNVTKVRNKSANSGHFGEVIRGVFQHLRISKKITPRGRASSRATDRIHPHVAPPRALEIALAANFNRNLIADSGLSKVVLSPIPKVGF